MISSVSSFLIVLAQLADFWRGEAKRWWKDRVIGKKGQEGEICLWAQLGEGEHMDLASWQGPAFTNSSQEEWEPDKLLRKPFSQALLSNCAVEANSKMYKKAFKATTRVIFMGDRLQAQCRYQRVSSASDRINICMAFYNLQNALLYLLFWYF